MCWSQILDILLMQVVQEYVCSLFSIPQRRTHLFFPVILEDLKAPRKTTLYHHNSANLASIQLAALNDAQ